MSPTPRDPRLERLHDPDLPAAERERLEAEVLADPKASEALYADASLESALGAATRVPTSLSARRRRSRRGLMVALPIAAALALLWLGPRWRELSRTDSPPRFRGETTQLRALGPTGAVTVPPRFYQWSSVAAAEQYRFELYDGASRLLHSAVVADTSYALPVGTAGPRSGFWRVTPVSAAGRELPPSEPAYFHSR
jgi:hypothetical protein